MEVWDFRGLQVVARQDQRGDGPHLWAWRRTSPCSCACSRSWRPCTRTSTSSRRRSASSRAMGMTRNQIVRLFIYEAYVLVMSASLLGILIGCIMAWTMMLQRVLFTQLPVTVQFPLHASSSSSSSAPSCAPSSPPLPPARGPRQPFRRRHHADCNLALSRRERECVCVYEGILFL